jgi:phage baseplate assembly protein W
MVDIKMTNEGELEISDTGDLKMVYGDEQIAQEVLFRLKTTLGDWTLSPHIGASLEKFIGQPNTPLTHALIENEVLKALVRDNLLLSPSINAVAIGEHEVFILIEFGSIEEDERIIQIQSGLDLRKGLVFARIASRLLQ